MGADGVARANPCQCNKHQCGNDDGGPAEAANGVALGRRLGAPIAPNVTILVDVPSLRKI